MSLFVCSECRAIDNTAVADFWRQSRVNEPDVRRCSECQTGEWHGRFPKRTYDGTQIVQWVDGAWATTPAGTPELVPIPQEAHP